MFLLLGLLHGCHISLGVKKLFQNTVTVTVPMQTSVTAVTAATQTLATTGIAVTLTLTRVAAATQTSVTGVTAATQTVATGIASEPENQPMPVSVACVQKKKLKKH